jgi:acyl carrier protein
LAIRPAGINLAAFRLAELLVQGDFSMDGASRPATASLSHTIRDLLADVIGAEIAMSAGEDEPLGELGLDSLDIATLLMRLEDALAVRIPMTTDEFEEFGTIGEIGARVRALLDAR